MLRLRRYTDFLGEVVMGVPNAKTSENVVDSVEAVRVRVVDRELQSSDVVQFDRHLVESLTLILPAFNEEGSIEKAVRRASTALGKYCSEFEIIVVNDGSSDGTAAILEELRRDCPTLRVVHHPYNLGYGAALCSGIYSARCRHISFMDSDLQFDPEEIHGLLRWADDYDIVAGYRVDRADPWFRKLNAWAWNNLVTLVLGIKVRDIDCAFKVFRREVFDAIKLESVGAMVNTEIFARAKTFGFTVREIPVKHFPREHGEQTGADLAVILKAFRELLSIHRKLGGRGRFLGASGARIGNTPTPSVTDQQR